VSSIAPTIAAPPNVRTEDGNEAVVLLPDGTGATTLVYRIGANYYEEILGFSFQIVTSAAVGARTVVLRLSDASSNIVYQAPAAGTQAASLTGIYFYSPTYAAGVMPATGFYAQPIPDLLLQPGMKLQVVAFSGDAADVYNNAVVYTRRFPSGPYLRPALALAPTPLVA
jgi:hypothetical protein